MPKQVGRCLKKGDTWDFKQELYHLRSMIFAEHAGWLSFPQRKHTHNFWISSLIFLLEACFSVCSSVANFGPFYIGQEQMGL